MKRYIIILITLLSLHLDGQAIVHGTPMFRNFTAKEYNAHNRNFDIACDNFGTVFVANFEGLLYYDGALWRKIHTPGISRVTRLAKGRDGRIWVGGYNIFGYLVSDNLGRLQMKLLLSDINAKGNLEVDLINTQTSQVTMHTIDGRTFQVRNGKTLVDITHGKRTTYASVKDSISYLRLPDGIRINYNSTSGMNFHLPDNTVFSFSEANGLISNSINFITFNNINTLWGATENGLFRVEVATPYSQLTEREGLKGEVYAINEIGSTLYIGTLNGLFMVKNGKLYDIKEISLACYALIDDGHGHLIAPTSQGLYLISSTGCRKLTNATTMSVYYQKETGSYLTGELDGVYRVSANGQKTKLTSIEKVTKITSKNGKFILESIYGALWEMTTCSGKVSMRCIRKNPDVNEPKVSYRDSFGRLWLTDGNGNNLKIENNPANDNTALWIHPLCSRVLNTVYVSHDGNIIAGGDFGINIIDSKAVKAIKIQNTHKPYIRQIVVMGDSVIWGGYDPHLGPVSDYGSFDLPSNCQDVTIYFSVPDNSLIAPTYYRYRIDGGAWSQWTTETQVTFNNPSYGRTTVEIQSRGILGRSTDISTVKWKKAFPWYWCIWSWLFYVCFFIYISTLIFRWRERRLKREKEKLEGIVKERTSELSEAYSKQKEISSELSDTLDDLKRTQEDLVRMERTATAGKLTQGLIDRILNPINYINNFSKLTSGLAKDMAEDIEDEKENMTEDNYEDCQDLLDMMKQNLTKIEEHGVNTTRTLRAMEAMLNNHVGTLVNQDICYLCRQAVEVTMEHSKEDISRCGISIRTQLPDEQVMVDYDNESMNRVLLSVLSNGIYAVVKKFSQSPYPNPEVLISVRKQDDHVIITIRDNGIGIEDTIKDKVFDPFFTTKPTGEAAGVGLYLVRETINDHKGTITLDSVKGEFCEFTITL